MIPYHACRLQSKRQQWSARTTETERALERNRSNPNLPHDTNHSYDGQIKRIKSSGPSSSSSAAAMELMNSSPRSSQSSLSSSPSSSSSTYRFASSPRHMSKKQPFPHLDASERSLITHAYVFIPNVSFASLFLLFWWFDVTSRKLHFCYV